ncbi:MAG: hypothetical protein HUK22_03810 [Thermoguttaceae bacterium]|nr:hypothetical protein [Thermoguttaceae bacterium]
MRDLYRKLTFGALICCVVGAAAISTGCGKNKNGTVPVSVKITYNGSPVEEAVVVFRGEDPAQTPASGATDRGGVAKLSSFEPKDGAKPGKYLVTVEKAELVEERDPNDPTGDRILSSETVYHIPKNYGNAGTSGLTAEVVAGKKNSFEFNLDDSNADAEAETDVGIVD